MENVTRFKNLPQATQDLWVGLMENIKDHSCLQDFYKDREVNELIVDKDNKGFYPFYSGGLQINAYTTHNYFSSSGTYPDHIKDDFDDIVGHWDNQNPNKLYKDISKNSDSEIMQDFYAFEIDWLLDCTYDLEVKLTLHVQDRFFNKLDKAYFKITVKETGKADRSFRIDEGDFDDNEIKEHLEKIIVEGLL